MIKEFSLSQAEQDELYRINTRIPMHMSITQSMINDINDFWKKKADKDSFIFNTVKVHLDRKTFTAEISE